MSQSCASLLLPMLLVMSSLQGQVPSGDRGTASKNEVVLKPSQILVKGSVFSDKCKTHDLTLMDESKEALEGTNEGPVPSTHQIDYEQPSFTVIYNIYPSVAEAQKGFEDSNQKVAGNSMSQSTPIITDDFGYSCFAWGVLGRSRTKTTRMHNFVMHLQDAFGELSPDQSNAFFEKYAAHIAKQAGSNSAKKAGEPMALRLWTSSDGKTVKAKLLSVDKASKTIALELENGRRMEAVPLSRFGKADQEFVEKAGVP